IGPMKYLRNTHEFAFLAPTAEARREVASAPVTSILRAWHIMVMLSVAPDAHGPVAARVQDLFDALGDCAEPTLAGRARSVLDAQWWHGVRASNVARALRTAEAYLCRAFRQAFGVTMTGYV